MFRVADAAGAVAGGALLVAASAYLIYWNECRVVKMRRGIRAAKQQAREAAANKVDPANDNELVFVRGEVTADAAATAAVRDPDFALAFAPRAGAAGGAGAAARQQSGASERKGAAVSAASESAPALLKLRREVEMLAHVKKEKTTRKKEKAALGGTETVTTHTRTWYELEWKSTAGRLAGATDGAHRNREPRHRPATVAVAAGAARLGAFTLSPGLVAQARPGVHRAPQMYDIMTYLVCVF